MYLSIYTFVYVGIAFRLSLSPFHLFLYLCMYTFPYLGISFICFCTNLCTPTFVHFLSDSVSALILPSSFLSLSVSHPLVGRRQSADCKIRKTHKKLQTLIPSHLASLYLSHAHTHAKAHTFSQKQCDQIGRFSNDYGVKFYIRSCPNIWGLLGHFEKHHSFVSKNCCG